MGQQDRGAHSNTSQEQMKRWVIFIEQWERALASGKEVIVLGDCNLDHQKFNNSGAEQPLVDIMVEKIYPHGVTQCVQGPTRSWPGQVSSGLDHIYTNVPEKLSRVQVKKCGSSDHSLVFATRFAKNMKENIRYCRKNLTKTLMRNSSLKRLTR